MINEITAAVNFISAYLEPVHCDTESLLNELYYILEAKCLTSAWDNRNPLIGNAYRSINFNNDPIFELIADKYLIDSIHDYFPKDLVLWIDPDCVSYRIGDHGYCQEIPHLPLEYSGHEYYQTGYESGILVI